MGTIQAFRVSLWITTSGRSDLWTTSSSLPVAEVYVPCRGCFVASAFLCVLSCARFLVRAGPVVCVDCSLRVGAARKSSPCGVIRIGKREKVRPARQKWSVFGVFELAGRVFSRFGQDEGVAGRTFSRREATGALLGELFRAGMARGRCWANFFAVWAGWDNAGGFMCARRAGGARGLLVACWGSAKKFALRGEADREARKSSPCSAKMVGFR